MLARLSLLIPAVLFVACSSEEPRAIEHTTSSVVNTLVMPKADKGVAPGFDLDGVISDRNDGRGCYHADLTSPGGELGVDNQLSTLIPLFDVGGEGALASLVQQAVNDGRLLLVFDISKMDDGTYDVTMLRGDDMPLIGTDGRVLSDQTIALDGEPVIAKLTGVVPVDGVIEVGPLPLEVPVVVFDGVYKMELPEGRLRIELDDAGYVVRGVMGGGMPASVLEQLTDQAAVRLESDFIELVRNGVEDAKDMGRGGDGGCDSLSMAVTFETVPAYIF